MNTPGEWGKTGEIVGVSPDIVSVLNHWHPKPVLRTRTISARGVEEFSRLLDLEDEGQGQLPPLWHWFEFSETVPTKRVGFDGHPESAELMPPIPDRRRMWGGGRFILRDPMRVGDTVSSTSEVVEVKRKLGKSGELVVVTERHSYSRSGDVVAVDEFDILYRTGGMPATESVSLQPYSSDRPVVSVTEIGLSVRPDPVFLQRFSALTSNSHRIHYDAAYAVAVEHHPSLVVQGPLIALLLLETARRSRRDGTVSDITCRMLKPAYVGDTIVCGIAQNRGSELHLAARKEGAEGVMDAKVTYV